MEVEETSIDELKNARVELARMKQMKSIYAAMRTKFIIQIIAVVATLLLGANLAVRIYSEYESNRIHELNQKQKGKIITNTIRYLHEKMPKKSAKWLEKEFPDRFKD